MKFKNKVLVFVAILLLVPFFFTTLIIALNFKEFHIENEVKKATAIANTIQSGLTAHMVNGIMDKREFFLKDIANTKNIDRLWIVRSQEVIKQYGKGLLQENIKDKIDKQVLETGKPVYKVVEGENEKVMLRATIPYKAELYGSANCMSCHNVKVDSVLGIVSMEFDITDGKYNAIYVIGKIFLTTIALILMFFFIANRMLKKYFKLAKQAEESLEKTYQGDFSYKIEKAFDIKELNRSIDLYNKLLDYMEVIIKLFNESSQLPSRYNFKSSNWKDIIKTLNLLSKVNRFKKVVELDKTISQVYERILFIVKEVMKSDKIIIFRSNNQEFEMIYSYNDSSICQPVSVSDQTDCRAYRTSTEVSSVQFPKTCQYYCGDSKYHLCLPYRITDKYTLVISLLTDNEDEAKFFQSKKNELSLYIESVRSSIESHVLMQQLVEKSLHDGLTGVYNRKFLEDFVERVTYQSDRRAISYGVLMIDIDHFKQVNDTYGHDIGDKFIQLVAKTVKSIIRKADTISRYGGEEFVVLLYECDIENARKIAEKIRIKFSQSSIYNGKEHIKRTISIGVSYFSKDSKIGLRDVIKEADMALYEAKNRGRDQVVVYKNSKNGTVDKKS